MSTIIVYKKNELAHHGILGQKWGKKNGPPYPLGASDHSASEKKAGWKKSLGGGRNESEYGKSDGKKYDKAKKHQALADAYNSQNKSGTSGYQRGRAAAEAAKHQRKSDKLRQNAKELKRLYDEAEAEEYKKAGEKLEKLSGDDYFNEVDRIQRNAYKKSVQALKEKKGDLSSEDIKQIVDDKRSGNQVKRSRNILKEDEPDVFNSIGGGINGPSSKTIRQQKKEEKALAKQQRKENKAFEKAKEKNWIKSYNEASAEFERKVKAINDKYDVGIEYGKDGKLTKESQKYVQEVGALWTSIYKESLYRNIGEGTSTIGKDWVDSMPMMRMLDDL